MVASMSATLLAHAGKRYKFAKGKEREAMAYLYLAIQSAVDGGMSEVEAAKAAGVDRGTVRRALGKPRV